MMPSVTSAAVARPRIALLFGVALFVAGVLLVTVVLPAEYGADPLGTGARLGLLPLGVVGQQVDALNAATSAQSGQSAIVVDQERPFHEDTITFALGPHESVEYKYRLEKGKALLYSWTSTALVNVELHAEPDGAPAGYAQTYEKQRARQQASGTLTVPFTGIHGWYWENTTGEAATVTLKAAGFFSMSHEFRKDQPVRNRTF
jgi:hypothetical protein